MRHSNSQLLNAYFCHSDNYNIIIMHFFTKVLEIYILSFFSFLFFLSFSISLKYAKVLRNNKQ